MCGIAGAISLNSQKKLHIDEKQAQLVLDSQAHRGREGGKFYLNESYCFFHNLLKITDPSEKSRQPMDSQSGLLKLIFNGEIYNSADLYQSYLAGAEVKFEASADARVLTELLDKKSIDIISKLNGDFAFCYSSGRKFFLARDRFGIKPLYYAIQNEVFYFASEIRGLFALGVKREVNYAVLSDYLQWRYCKTTETPYVGILRFPAAHYAEIDSHTGTVVFQKYWDSLQTVGSTSTKDLQSVLLDSVQIRNDNSNPTSCLFSAGLDSSFVLSQLKSETLALVYNQEYSPDGEYAKEALNLFKNKNLNLDHVQFEESHWVKAIDTLEEPIGDSVICAFDRMFAEASKHSRVCYTGEGADEVFFGYGHQQLSLYLEKLWPLRKVLLFVLELFGEKSIKFLWSSRFYPISYSKGLYLKLKNVLQARDYRELSLNLTSILDKSTAEELLCDQYRKTFQQRNNDLYKELQNAGLSFCDTQRAEDLQSWLENYNLLRQDKLSMRYALEVRSPFLDHRAVEIASTLFQSANVGQRKNKNILRSALGTLLPNKLLKRKKTPFYVSDTSSDHIYLLAKQVLSKERLLSTKYFSSDAISIFLKAYQPSQLANKQLAILIAIQLWLEREVSSVKNH